MKRFLLKRLFGLVFVLVGISLLVFGLMAMIPGDTATAILGAYATPERVQELQKELGLDGSLLNQYVNWLANVLSGDLGHSYAFDRPVTDLVLERLGPTAMLSLAALALGTVLGLSLGSVAAAHNGRPPDKLLTLVAVASISTPAFWLAMMMMLVFGVWLEWFPVSGMQRPWSEEPSAVELLRHLILPAAALGVVAAGVIARLTRTEMLEALGESYIRTARAKGVPESVVAYRHAFKVALARVVPVIGLQAGFVLGGAVYIETVFQWPGFGSLLVEAIAKRDVLLVQGGVLVVATGYVLINLLTDIIQFSLDPRIEP